MQCLLEIPAIPGLADGEITVGREAIFHCAGELEKSFNLDAATVKITGSETASNYLLKILKVERRDLNSFDVVFTSYVPGNHSIPDVAITDGSGLVSLGPLKLEVKSVIEQNQQQPPQPFGPMGPLRLPVPMFVWIVLGILILITAVSGAAAWRKRKLRKAWEIEKKKYSVRLTPIMQLYVDNRRIERKWKELTLEQRSSELLRLFDEYLIRKFDWPLPQLRRKQVSSLIKSEFKNEKTLAQQLSELHRTLYLSHKKKTYSEESLQQVMKDMQILIERVERDKRIDLA
ncbi:MAG: hypothetical protein V4736_06955 [Bdellovibrionota bacterium]